LIILRSILSHFNKYFIIASLSDGLSTEKHLFASARGVLPLNEKYNKKK
jgi:hypothetical protein